MTIRYRVTSRDPDATPPEAFAYVGETNGTTYDGPPLPPGVRREYQVNAYDTGTGLADENADARLTVRVADDGSDATTLPNAPSLVAATARPAGTALVTWGYAPGGQGAAPAGFHVYRWAAGSPDYTTPAATAGYRRDANRPYSATLTGLTGGVSYGVAVRAFNATGEESNAAVVTVTAATAGPSAVTSLTAAATA